MIGRRSAFVMLLATASTVATLVIGTGPALAAPVSGAQPHSVAAVSSPAAAPGSSTTATTMTSGSTDTASAAASASATTYCKTSTSWIDNLDVVGIILFSFNMSTYWCYDNVIVTYHSTGVNHSITGTGTATGWEWIGHSGIDFSCYKASGSSRNCSGNEEHSTGYFYNFLTGQSCSDTLHQWENYKGQFFYSASTTC